MDGILQRRNPRGNDSLFDHHAGRITRRNANTSPEGCAPTPGSIARDGRFLRVRQPRVFLRPQNTRLTMPQIDLHRRSESWQSVSHSHNPARRAAGEFAASGGARGGRLYRNITP